jgi:hypothetical protein
MSTKVKQRLGQLVPGWKPASKHEVWSILLDPAFALKVITVLELVIETTPQIVELLTREQKRD